MTATAVAPEPMEAPPPPEDRANTVSSSSLLLELSLSFEERDVGDSSVGDAAECLTVEYG